MEKRTLKITIEFTSDLNPDDESKIRRYVGFPMSLIEPFREALNFQIHNSVFVYYPDEPHELSNSKIYGLKVTLQRQVQQLEGVVALLQVFENMCRLANVVVPHLKYQMISDLI